MYSFAEKEENIFGFKSDLGFLYEVAFSPLDFAILDKNDIKKYVYELSIEIVNDFEKLPPKDQKIETTIAQIIKHFFTIEPSNFAIFHISTYGKKTSSRKRLFTNWFEKNNDGFLEKYDRSVEDPHDIFYISLILRTNNPSKSQILTYFYNWIETTNTVK